MSVVRHRSDPFSDDKLDKMGRRATQGGVITPDRSGSLCVKWLFTGPHPWRAWKTNPPVERYALFLLLLEPGGRSRGTPAHAQAGEGAWAWYMGLIWIVWWWLLLSRLLSEHLRFVCIQFLLLNADFLFCKHLLPLQAHCPLSLQCSPCRWTRRHSCWGWSSGQHFRFQPMTLRLNRQMLFYSISWVSRYQISTSYVCCPSPCIPSPNQITTFLHPSPQVWHKPSTWCQKL